jgi:hypothetical protein
VTLPVNLEQEFWQEYSSFEEYKRMQYVTSVEKIGIQKGKQEALLKGIALGLKLKFGEPGLNLLPSIESINDVELLETILSAIETTSTIDELQSTYQ